MSATDFTRRSLLAGAPAILTAKAAGQKLRVAFVGVGNRGSFLLKNGLEVADIEVVAVCDIVEERAQKAAQAVAAKGGQARVWTDFRKMLDTQKDIEAVVLATPDWTHKDFDIVILEMGKSLYAEKPLATSIEDCKAVVTAAKQAKGTFQAGFQLRHDPNRNAGEALIHSGKIGKVLMCHGIRHGGDLPRDIPWYFDKTRTGDIIVDQGIHILDLFRWAIGKAPAKVAGFGGINLFVNVPPGRTVMDNYTLAIEYPGGERVNFSHHYFDPPGFTSIQERVFCEGGAVDLAKGTWMPRERRSPPIPLETPDAGKDSTYMALKAFAESVRNKSLPINNAESAFLSTAQALMATKAVYEGRVVTWEEITRGA